MNEIKNVSKKFGKTNVLNDISITINKGEVVGLLGSNGSGKTTLMEIVVGQLKPTSGTVEIDGKKDGYKKVGIQFQEGIWPKGLNCKTLIKYFKSDWSAFKREEVQKIIKIFEIEDFINKDLNELSGGQKQRLNTLLAVLNNPDYICLDEMITGLDLKMQLKLVAYFKELKKQQKTMLIISHIPEEVEELCDKLIILDKGSVYYSATIDDVKKNYKSVRNLLITYYNGGLK